MSCRSCGVRFATVCWLVGGLCGAEGTRLAAFTTSSGQFWPTSPDAWVRGNAADRAYFGWDLLEPSGMRLGFGQVLDDSTPDLGLSASTIPPRFFQGADGVADPSPTVYGHRSGSGNFYTGFGADDFVNNTITGVGPGPAGTEGYTTLVLQILGGAPSGQGSQPIEGLQFALGPGTWTHTSSLYGTIVGGTGVYWQEWTSVGGGLPLEILLSSVVSSRSFDAVQVDAYWTSGTEPVRNARTSVQIPEPASFSLIALGACVASIARRRRIVPAAARGNLS